jgi:2-methylcitrate dehydratase PrpD
MSATAAFARHALETSFSAIPRDAVAAAQTFILDTIGVGVAGASAANADLVLKSARRWGAPMLDGAAHVFGSSLSLPAPVAAFVNGFQIHCQEFDCVHEAAVVHPMATIFAALAAEIESRPGASGADLLAAVIVAVDIAAALGVAATAPIRFFRPANAGLFGATLGVARLRGFSLDRALDAAGHALAQCSGTMQAHVEGTPALPVQIGNAARAALVAADLAEAGLEGPRAAIEGPYGYLELFEAAHDVEPSLASLGAVWRIREVSMKPFPTGRAAQGGIDLAARLRADGVDANEVETITLKAPPIVPRLVGRPWRPDMSVAYARLCFQYSGAVALLKGTVGLGDFTPEAFAGPSVAAIAQKIRIETNDVSDPAAFAPQEMEARLKGGRTRAARIDGVLGAPAAPLSRDAQLQKFRAACRFGAPGLSDRVDEIITRVAALEEENDAARFIAFAAGA